MPHSPILQTKLYIPPIRSGLVPRPRLIERLNEGLSRKLTLPSAPAGFGKTTLVSEWLAGCAQLEPKLRAAWLSLDEGDNDPAQIQVPGELDESWLDWIRGMTIAVESKGKDPPVTILTGTVDQAALHGVLRRLYSLGLPLISVHHVEA